MTATTTTVDGATAEAKAQAEAFKADGNEFMKQKQYTEAVDMYTRAIELDPDNHVYFSNRSAAYLAMGDARGKALKDAEMCITLRPDWWKGYSRKGAAEHALQRFDAARATYNQGLKLDPDNASLLEAAEEAYKAGQEYSQRLREQAQQEERRKKEEEERVLAEKAAAEAANAAKKAAEATDADALFAEFMSEVQELEENTNCIKKPGNDAVKEKPPVDFGTSEGQLVRLLQEHYAWINLNPFRVLMLDTDATEEDIKQHYRKISTLVHPDKFQHPRAREAFEEVKKAYNVIMQEDRRKTYARLIANTKEKVDKERRVKIKKGIKESELGSVEDAYEKAVLAAFAEMEHRRQNLEKREAAQRRRETEQMDKDQQKMTEDYKRERSWAETDRRDQRVGNWRNFQKQGKRQRELDRPGWKEEKREKKEFGVVDNDVHKRQWK